MPESTSLPNSGNPNNYLKNLKVNDILVTGFDGADENYEVYVSNNVDEALITAETVNYNAKVTNILSRMLFSYFCKKSLYVKCGLIWILKI